MRINLKRRNVREKEVENVHNIRQPVNEYGRNVCKF